MFFQYVLDNVKKYPDKLAVKDSQRELSYEELWQEVLWKRTIALRKGITDKAKIMLAMHNCCEWVTDFMAFAVLGAKVIMISPDTKEEQIQIICEKLDISVVITKESSAFFFDLVTVNVSDNINFPSNNTEIVYHVTSGSTGEFKMCIRTVGQFVAEGIMFQDRLDISKEDTIVCPIPIYHSYAFGAVFISGLMAGAGIVLMEKFVPYRYLQLLAVKETTLSFAVPAIVRILLSTRLSEQIDLSHMHYIVVGAGAITKDVFIKFKEKFNIFLSSNYGSSETGGIFTRTEMSEYQSVGKPMKNVIVQIRTGEGEEVALGEEGDLWVKAPSVMNRYYDKADNFDKKGFFFTGDLAKMDTKGNIYITGRKKNIVNVGGKKVNPLYVEDIIKSFINVEEAVVVGGKKASGEEYIATLIIGKKNFDLKELKSFLKDKLEQYMIPSVIKVVDTIPKNNVGKVDRTHILSLIETYSTT